VYTIGSGVRLLFQVYTVASRRGVMAQQKEEDWIGLREFARRVKVNVNAVQKGIANGRIQRRELDKKIHWPTQKKAWDGNLDPSKVRDHNATAKAKKAVNAPIAKPQVKTKAKVKSKAKQKAQPVTHEEFEEQLSGEDPEGDEDDSGSERDAGSDDLVYGYERARKTRSEADLKEIEVDERRGLLVQQVHVKHAMVRFAVELRDAILDIPDRVVAGLTADLVSTFPAGAIDVQEIERIVLDHWHREAKEALEKLRRVHG
jgi:hypothetical protein